MDNKRESKKITKPLTNGFILSLEGKRVTIRLITGGQIIVGTIEGYNPYEILVQTAKGPILIFKHSIAAIEPQRKP